jgi:hypothetical protein
MVGKVGHYDLLVSEHGAAKVDVQHLAKFLLGCLFQDMHTPRDDGVSSRTRSLRKKLSGQGKPKKKGNKPKKKGNKPKKKGNKKQK